VCGVGASTWRLSSEAAREHAERSGAIGAVRATLSSPSGWV
jgi:hypothetical protein